jgi:hypothetical protein
MTVAHDSGAPGVEPLNNNFHAFPRLEGCVFLLISEYYSIAQHVPTVHIEIKERYFTRPPQVSHPMTYTQLFCLQLDWVGGEIFS